MKFPKVHQVYPVNWKCIYSLLEHTLVHTHTHKHQTSRWESLTLHAGHHSAMVAVGGMPVWQAARGLSLPGNGHRYPYRGLSHLSLPLSFPWVLACPLRALILPRWRGSPRGQGLLCLLKSTARTASTFVVSLVPLAPLPSNCPLLEAAQATKRALLREQQWLLAAILHQTPHGIAFRSLGAQCGLLWGS